MCSSGVHKIFMSWYASKKVSALFFFLSPQMCTEQRVPVSSDGTLAAAAVIRGTLRASGT